MYILYIVAVKLDLWIQNQVSYSPRARCCRGRRRRARARRRRRRRRRRTRGSRPPPPTARRPPPPAPATSNLRDALRYRTTSLHTTQICLYLTSKGRNSLHWVGARGYDYSLVANVYCLYTCFPWFGCSCLCIGCSDPRHRSKS